MRDWNDSVGPLAPSGPHHTRRPVALVAPVANPGLQGVRLAGAGGAVQHDAHVLPLGEVRGDGLRQHLGRCGDAVRKDDGFNDVAKTKQREKSVAFFEGDQMSREKFSREATTLNNLEICYKLF